MQFPRVYINGNSGLELLKQYTDAMEKLSEAMAALGVIDVSGRDYYVLGREASQAAQREHRERMAKLASVGSDLMTIALNIQDQIMARAEPTRTTLPV